MSKPKWQYHAEMAEALVTIPAVWGGSDLNVEAAKVHAALALVWSKNWNRLHIQEEPDGDG